MRTAQLMDVNGMFAPDHILCQIHNQPWFQKLECRHSVTYDSKESLLKQPSFTGKDYCSAHFARRSLGNMPFLLTLYYQSPSSSRSL